MSTIQITKVRNQEQKNNRTARNIEIYAKKKWRHKMWNTQQWICKEQAKK